jgi:hypothetical protein
MNNTSAWLLVGNCCLFPLAMLWVGWTVRGLWGRAHLQWPLRVDEDKPALHQLPRKPAARPPEDRLKLGGGG